MDKFVIFAFRGDEMCFTHVLLNALDMSEKGIDVKIVIEGEAVALVRPMIENENKLFDDAKEKGLIDCICRACSGKMGVLEYNECSEIPLRGGISGHPAMSGFIADGYSVITM